MKRDCLRPHDVIVLLELTLRTPSGFRGLAEAVGLSLGETHNAAKRLELARLVELGSWAVDRAAAADFLTLGVPYAFPAQLGAPAEGIRTAPNAKPSGGDSSAGFVWPAPGGGAHGVAVAPLHSSAVELPETNPPLYDRLALLDGIRVAEGGRRTSAEEAFLAHLEGRARSHLILKREL